MKFSKVNNYNNNLSQDDDFRGAGVQPKEWI